jgi:hypothetical protein
MKSNDVEIGLETSSLANALHTTVTCMPRDLRAVKASVAFQVEALNKTSDFYLKLVHRESL